jgi:hypothetical protein
MVTISSFYICHKIFAFLWNAIGKKNFRVIQFFRQNSKIHSLFYNLIKAQRIFCFLETLEMTIIALPKMLSSFFWWPKCNISSKWNFHSFVPKQDLLTFYNFLTSTENNPNSKDFSTNYLPTSKICNYGSLCPFFLNLYLPKTKIYEVPL